MIGQDESHCVYNKLLGCLPYVDELIFVDGGSIDNTVALVGSIPKSRVYHVPFPDHFAQQRNECLKHATKDWILIKDCDELFDFDLLYNLQSYTQMGGDAVAFPRKTYIDGSLYNFDAQEHFDRTIRFWENHKGIHFENKLHECVVGFETMKTANAWLIHPKTNAEQQKDNQKYHAMGQR